MFYVLLRFPGQQKVAGDSKIQSVVCYDEDGTVAAVGSETDPDTNPELFESPGIVRSEWYSEASFLVSAALKDFKGLNCIFVPLAWPLSKDSTRESCHYLRNKIATAIYSDVLRYLFDATKRYIQERQGDDMWNSVEDDINFILSHPNGWEGRQQSEMRNAAISAGLVKSEAEALDRVSFVTEGEASLHYCLNNIPTVLERLVRKAITHFSPRLG